MTIKEFELRQVNGMPDINQFYERLPLHGGYRFEFETHGDLYRFEIVQEGRSYRTYIRHQPSYGSRRSDGHSTHRLLAGDGSMYICHKAGHEPTDLPMAAAVATWWAKCTSRYIRDGKDWS